MKIPPLVPQNISSEFVNPKWMRWHFLEYMAKRFGWRYGAELGVWEGKTIGHLLERVPDLNMIGVDLWEPQPDNQGPENYKDWPHGQNEQRARARCASFGERARLFKERTADAARLVHDSSLDFVFIDADHSEQAVRLDISIWAAKLKPTGWLVGHDINWPGVRAAVEDLAPGYLIGPNVVWFRPLNPAEGWQKPFGGAQ